jgi:hypothetical protein
MIYQEVIERHDCVKAQEALDRVLNEKPEQYHEDVVGVSRCLVAMRDHFIRQLSRGRAQPRAPEACPRPDGRHHGHCPAGSEGKRIPTLLKPRKSPLTLRKS